MWVSGPICSFYSNRKTKKKPRHFFVYLWDDGEFGPQVVKAYFSYLHVIDGDLSCCGFQQPEEAESHGGLAGACATHNANLGSHKNRDIRKPSSPPVTCLVAWSINLSFYHIFFFFFSLLRLSEAQYVPHFKATRCMFSGDYGKWMQKKSTSSKQSYFQF